MTQENNILTGSNEIPDADIDTGLEITDSGNKESLTDRLNRLLPPKEKRFTATEGSQSAKAGLWWVYLLALTGMAVFLFSVNSGYLSKRFIWNTRIANQNIGGMTVSEARAALQEYVNTILAQDVVLSTGTGDFVVSSSALGTEFNLETVLNEAFKKGHANEFWPNQKARFASLFGTELFELSFTVNEERFNNQIISKIPELKKNRPRDAKVFLSNEKFITTADSGGLGFDEYETQNEYKKQLKQGAIPRLRINIQPKNADIDLVMARNAARIAWNVSRRFLIMKYSYDGYNYDSWSLSLREIRDWFEFKKEKTYGNYNLAVVLNNEKLRKHLSRRIAPYMYMAKEDIVIKNANGQVAVDGVAKDGYYLDLRNSVNTINEHIQYEKIDTSGNVIVMLSVAHLTGGVANPDNEFNISDVLATGVTDFFGSPENRKFNIKHASSRFHNIVLHPGERFSFIKYMGKIDSVGGFAKELVIVNGDSTEPQYGGGICQISSTLFRTIFFAGLKVIARASHSFEVKYYRPAGLDATVFDPHPNLIFENDTKNLLLIQNYVDLKRTKMYFKFFGKNDGRRLRFEGPTVKDSVGELKEHYRVTWVRYIEYADGTTDSEKFHSVYKNKDLVKKYQPENLFIQKDSVFVPVSLDTAKLDKDYNNIPPSNTQKE